MKNPFDMAKMMRQAQELSGRMKQAQEELKHRTAEATVGGGMVHVVVNGAMELVQIKIDPQAVDPRDVAMLQDLILAAVNQAQKNAQQMVAEELQKVTGADLAGLFGGAGGDPD